jgi:Aromatic-ring-opening dioxygenase LigAB, LigA subunit
MAEEGSSSLLGFINRLTDDDELRAAFERDPHAAIDASDLSQEAKDALKSRDVKQIQAHIDNESGGTAPQVAMIFWYGSGEAD